MSDTDKKVPLNTFKDGAVTIKIWEQQSGDQTYVNASVGKLYRDEQTGQWRESRSFNSTDLLKLQTMIPEARQDMQRWQEYFRTTQMLEYAQESLHQQAPPQRQSPAQYQAPPQQAAPQQQSLAARRDSIMNPKAPPNRPATNTPVRNPSRDRSR